MQTSIERCETATSQPKSVNPAVNSDSCTFLAIMSLSKYILQRVCVCVCVCARTHVCVIGGVRGEEEWNRAQLYFAFHIPDFGTC